MDPGLEAKDYGPINRSLLQGADPVLAQLTVTLLAWQPEQRMKLETACERLEQRASVVRQEKEAQKAKKDPAETKRGGRIGSLVPYLSDLEL
jgi:hypothetical protein